MADHNSAILEALPLAVLRVKQRKLQAQKPQQVVAHQSLREWIDSNRLIDGKPLDDYVWMHEIYEDEYGFKVFKKAAQVMFSEYFINVAFWVSDQKIGGRGNVLYLYPTQIKLNDFSHARVDKAITDSPTLKAKMRGINNVTLKKVNNAFIYFRGSDKKLMTIDADLVILDEFDEMREGVLVEANKRLGSSYLSWRIIGSTPSYPGVGIDAEYEDSDQRKYMVPCDHCGTRQPLVWEQVDLDIEEYLCEHCHMVMNRFVEGEWIATKDNSKVHGYHLNKLYSPRANLSMMIESSLDTSPIGQQEHYNSDRGLAFAPEGTTLGLNELEGCVNHDYDSIDFNDLGLTYMGVDVGTFLHVIIFEIRDGKKRLVFCNELNKFSELDKLMYDFKIKRAVVDAQPEIREPKEFANRFKNRVALCRYMENFKWDKEDFEIHVNRTEEMDDTFGLVIHQRTEFPYNARYIGGRGKISDRYGSFYQHMMAQNRILYKDARGNTKAKYDEGGKPDHYAHAMNYANIASKEQYFTPKWAKIEFTHLSQEFEKDESEENEN